VNEKRDSLIRELLTDKRLDAILIFGRSNMRYLVGFTGSDGVLLVSAKETLFLTDSRYFAQAQQQVRADRIVCYKNKLKTVIEELSTLECRSVGFEAAAVNVAQYDDLETIASGRFDWTPLVSQLQPLRGVKINAELTALKAAANLNHRAFDAIFPLIRSGVTEREIALELEITLKRLGGEANAFDFIVASGTRGALPHGIASDKKVAFGELVTIDFGTRVDGYYSDETVTLAVGSVDRKLRQIFDIVLEAHDHALAAIQPGMPICELDAVARDFITSKGYGRNFGHGLGHGVGLEVHEFPAVSQHSEQKLSVGMVITIEPGIYLPGVGGVRIEDTVAVTATGYDALTTIPKQFKQICL